MRWLTGCLCVIVLSARVHAETPTAHFLFPAGGQRGTTVDVRVGGCNLHTTPRLIWDQDSITAAGPLVPVPTVWFEGPLIPQPASQQKEDYPRDFGTQLRLADSVPRGPHVWRLATSQGITGGWGFLVGSFPEVVESEVEGPTPAVRITVPVTVNGRIFPREDVDAWTFPATAGQTITCRVATAEFGSPLNARLEVRAPSGVVIAESLPEGNRTPDLRFLVPTDGDYEVRIHDIAYGGLQDHVYRLTITSGPVLDGIYPLGGRRGEPCVFELQGTNLPVDRIEVALPRGDDTFSVPCPGEAAGLGDVAVDLDVLPEYRETDSESHGVTFTVPAVLNGRIQAAGEVDAWSFNAARGTEYEVEVRSARLGSPLDPVIQISDSTGKVLSEVDDTAGLQSDGRLRWTSPADGLFQIRIQDRLASRGDRRFAYRVRVLDAASSELHLTLPTDAVTVDRGRTTVFKVVVDRGPGVSQPVEIQIENLPQGVSVTAPAAPIVVSANQKEVSVTLSASENAPISVVPLRVVGKTRDAGGERTAVAHGSPANPDSGRVAVADPSGRVWIATSVPTPFRFVGRFETKYIPRGSIFVRHYRIERNGFEGPLTVTLADRQGRHLQGVKAAPVLVPAGDSEFDFAVSLPPWMEIGRTCRSTLAVTGTVTDPDGTTHEISYSSNEQHNQMIALVDPGRFTLQLARATVRALPGQRLELPVQVQRGPGLDGPVELEVILPPSLSGVSANPVTITGGARDGMVTLKFATQLPGLQSHPAIVRATARDERNLPVTAEARFLLVP